MGIVVIGTAFVDIKGFPDDLYIPNGRNAGRVEYVHGGVARNVVEDIANMELRPTYLGIVDDTPMGADVLKKLQNHISENYYTCTKEILFGLGQMYVADERFKNNIDKHTGGTAAYVSEAIAHYCKK